MTPALLLPMRPGRTPANTIQQRQTTNRKARLVLIAVAAATTLNVAGCASQASKKSVATTAAVTETPAPTNASAYTPPDAALASPGFEFTFTGAVSGHVTQANARPLPHPAPQGTVGAGNGLAGCGPQPSSAHTFGGAYWIATQVNLAGDTVVLRLVVPHYRGPGSFPAASPDATPPGSAMAINGDNDNLVLARSGQITINDAESGSVSADFSNDGKNVHLTGAWHCPR